MTKDYYMDQAQEIITAGLYKQAVNLMDNDIREALHSKMSPCSDTDFLAAYMLEHYKKYGTDFTI